MIDQGIGLYCVLGIPLIVSAVKLFQASDAADRYRRTGDHKDAIDAIQGYHDAGKWFVINWIIIFVLVMIVVIGFVALGLSGALDNLGDKK